jgi:hypothetical protein
LDPSGIFYHLECADALLVSTLRKGLGAADDFFGEEMNTSPFYLCPICFYASDIPNNRHEHRLLHIDLGVPGDERRKLLTDRIGRILSPALLWFHDAVAKVRKTVKPESVDQPRSANS